jgi:glycerol-3-phosphate dehydrogenase
MYDVIVIGAGVIGTAIARELSRFEMNTLILERDNDVSNGTTKANSALIHAGYDAPFDSLKGKFNARGNEMFDVVCDELDVPFKRIGSLVVAHNDEEIETLKNLKENGEKLNIPGLKIISKDEVKEKEPNLNDDIIAALYAPTAGIIGPWELAIAYAENAIDNGVQLKLNHEVKSITKVDDWFLVSTNKGEFKTKYVVNAAGVYADKIYGMVTDTPEFSITPRRGQYYLLDKEAKLLVNHIVIPKPNKMCKGTLITHTEHGNTLVGPDSENLDLNDKEATNTTLDRLNHVKELASKITDKIPYRLNITTFAGLRAEPSTDDFIVEESKVAGFVNVAGIKSPGLSSAPAIAEYVIEIISKMNNGLKVNDTFNPLRRKMHRFEEMTNEERQEMIEKDPSYGRIICRCEMITEGEIVDAIHRSAGGTTLNGIKRRVRPGAGRCQGGFCGPRVAEILSRELGIEMVDVQQENVGSYILTGETKTGGEQYEL